MLFRAAFAVLVITALGLVAWRLLAFDDGPRPSERIASAPARSDYYMRDATIYQMNKQGQLAYRMRLRETLHFPDDSARLQDIHVHYEAGTPTWWALQAARGRVPAGSRDIHLVGGVTLRHPNAEGKIVVARTDNVWIRTRNNIVETDAHVTATGPDRVMEADGLRIDLDIDEMRLLDNVRTRYKP